MSATPLTNFSRLCIHTITTKPWSLKECIANFSKAGVPAITVWRQALEPQGLAESAKMLKGSGLRVTSLCRGGFFPAATADGRAKAIDDNRRAIEEARAIGAPHIVLVVGAVPGIPLPDARKMIADGIVAVLPEAKAAGVKLAIEPLHPMYANDRSAVNTMKQANDMVQQIGSPLVGVAVDVSHLWGDDMLEQESNRCAKLGGLMAFHVCDWRTPTREFLNDRGLMGEGCINIPQIRGWVEKAGFKGDIEVEIFSTELWATDQHQFLDRIKQAYLKSV
jgi:sugar phosphate isomerase/epimerase